VAGWDVYRLTTVRQDLRRMAQIAVETVLESVVEADRAPERIVLPPVMVRRATLGPPRRVEPAPRR
jgi:DNA-binding LacI/PurR family transcriptional regulator